MGATGVTGDVNEMDDICAIAGIGSAGLFADNHFSEKDQRRLNIKKNPQLKDPRKKHRSVGKKIRATLGRKRSRIGT